MPQMIVNADDFGASAGVNAGIFKAHRDGIVSSTTVMINLPDAAPGLGFLLQEAPELGIGLHINLTKGKPLSKPEHVRSLVNEDGEFHTVPTFLSPSTQLDADEIYEEIAAQLEHFLRIVGKPPTHLDSHYHISYLHPHTLEATLALANKYGRLPLRQFHLGASDKVIVEELQPFLPGVEETVLFDLVPQLRDILDKADPPPHMPTIFESGFSEPNLTLGDLLIILMGLSDETPTELMCHPGSYPDPFSNSAKSRQQESDILTHPTTLEVFERYHIQRIHYGHLQLET